LPTTRCFHGREHKKPQARYYAGPAKERGHSRVVRLHNVEQGVFCRPQFMCDVGTWRSSGATVGEGDSPESNSVLSGGCVREKLGKIEEA
jgi:hypothetical protein